MASEDVNLGGIPAAIGIRDAIHVAVISVKASRRLVVGQDVSLNDIGSKGDDVIGIVDPWRNNFVANGEVFWLCLTPKTITSLRHQWSHPAFPDVQNQPSDKEMSEIWLRSYAMRMNSYDSPDKAYENLVEGLRCGELFAHGSDLHSFSELDSAEELRFHAERVLGIRIEWDRFTFSCSC